MWYAFSYLFLFVCFSIPIYICLKHFPYSIMYCIFWNLGSNSYLYSWLPATVPIVAYDGSLQIVFTSIL